MKDTLQFLITTLVDHPEDVVIEERRAEGDDATIFVVHVHAEDMGRVIGKSGRIIRAVRDLMKIIAAKRNQFVDVELFEDAPPESA
jgi:predicted RNA-binding protein YlqC (UPF0109 family)